MDDRALRWVAAADHGPLAQVVTTTERAANYLVPWIGVSLPLLRYGTEDAKTSVVRGWAGMALSALLQDGVAKPLAGRERPDRRRLPRRQRKGSDPSTSSFPSGHSGAAMAFAVAAGREDRVLRWPLAALALAVAYAELYVGRHYLSDAIVGLGVGGASGAVVRHLPLPTPRGLAHAA